MTGTSSNSPTLSETATGKGAILGTAAYMAPEQAKGQSVDRRADVWAFGAVLYECLAGRRAFQGDTVTETLAGILKCERDWKSLPRDAPPKVCEVLERCLQKDARLRYHDIADARLDMEAAGAPGVAILYLRHWLNAVEKAQVLPHVFSVAVKNADYRKENMTG